VKARFYWVSHIVEIERQPWFEVERAKIVRQSRTKEPLRSGEKDERSLND